MSALNLTTIFKRTSLNVYEPDIFNCSQHPRFDTEGKIALGLNSRSRAGSKRRSCGSWCLAAARAKMTMGYARPQHLRFRGCGGSDGGGGADFAEVNLRQVELLK